MTKDEAVKRFVSGYVLAMGEYRMSKTEEINWRDKLSGRAMSGCVLRHTVEFGDVSCTVNERVPEGVKVEDVKVSFVKGEPVVLEVSEWTSQRGVISARGRLVHVTEGLLSPVKAPAVSGGQRAQ